MQKFGYLAMLTFTLCGSIWLEVVLKVGVIRRFKRVILSILPTALFFLIWDAYAIHSGHWYFDEKQILGIIGPFGIPLEDCRSHAAAASRKANPRHPMLLPAAILASARSANGRPRNREAGKRLPLATAGRIVCPGGSPPS